MKFTPGDLAELRKMGCVMDQIDQMVAERLSKRGFSATDFVGAYRAYLLLKKTNVEFSAMPRSQAIEHLAVARALRLSQMQTYTYLSQVVDKRRGPTSVFNSKFAGGKKLKLWGWITFGVGLGSMVIASATLGADTGSGCPGAGCSVSWILFFTIGGASSIASMVLLPLGYIKHPAGKLPPGLLESGSKEAIHRAVSIRTTFAKPTRVRFGFSPYVGRNSGGFSAILKF